MAGLTQEGLSIKRLDELRADLKARAVEAFGPSVKTDDTSVLGHLLGVHALTLVELWELAQALYLASSPDTATGAALDAVCALVGVTREPATFTTGTVTLSGEAGTLIPAGKLVRDASTKRTFALTATTVLDGAGTGEALVRAEEAGAFEASAGAVTEIVTPIPGWSSVVNASDLTSGVDAESDAALRLRRARSLQLIGAGPDAAIRARLEQLSFVTAARVISNRTLTAVGGIPPKAFRAVVWPDTLSPEQQHTIAQTIWATMPAGIEPDGEEAFTVTDAFGYGQTVRFSFAQAVPVYIRIELEVDAGFPADGYAQVKAAALAYLRGLTVGEGVRALRLLSTAAGVPGVVGASVLLGAADPPGSPADLVLAAHQIAVIEDAGSAPDAGDVKVVEA